MIVEFTKSTILMLDVNGQNTLHAAVKASYPQVTSILVAAMDPKGLHMENSVGNTVLDTVTLDELNSRIQRFLQTQSISMTELATSYNVDPFHRYPGNYIQKLEKELTKMDATFDALLVDGRLKMQTKIYAELTKFSSMMRERMSTAEATARLTVVQAEKIPEIKDPVDTPSVKKTTMIVLEALKDLTAERQLVHLIDVQKSVGAALEKAGNRLPQFHVRSLRRHKDKGTLEGEQDEDEEEKRQSMVWRYLNNTRSVDVL